MPRQRDANNNKKNKSEVEQLKLRLASAEETLDAIRAGQVDAIVVAGPGGDQVFTLAGTDSAYRVFVETMSEGAVTFSSDMTILYANRAFANMICKPLEHIIGASFTSLVTPSDRERFEAICKQPIDGSRKTEIRLRTDEGTLVPVFLSSNNFRETPSTICMVVTDLREQKRQEEVLATGRLANTILHQAAEAIAVCDSSGRIVLASHALHELCGTNPLFHHFDRVLPLALTSIAGERSGSHFSVGSVLQGEVFRALEVVFKNPRGEVVHMLLSASRLTMPAESPSGCVITLFNIEERKRAEDALRRSEKLAATGRLAATIAHEINNPLAAVTNLLYLLGSDGRLDPSLVQFAALAQNELARVSHITKQTLAFHRDTNTPIRVNLGDLIESVVYLYAQKFKTKQVRLTRELEFDGDVWGYPNELRQVISNIIENALEASPQNGHLRVRTYVSSEWNNSRKQGVRVVIGDVGSGIPKENLSRIFEPFFTTKGERGTGLGLWVSQGIVTKHGGFIRARSSTREGCTGTVFSIFLPLNVAHNGALQNSA